MTFPSSLVRGLRVGLVAVSLAAGLAGSLVASSAGAEEPAAAAAPALDPAVKAIVDRVEAKYAKVDTIEAKFTQVKKDSFGKVEQTGDVVLKRPNKMRWRFTSGDEQVFVSDGSTLWIYTKAENQVLRITDASQANAAANTFLTSLDSLDELFDPKIVATESGHTLDLTPKSSGMYKSIRLSLTDELVLSQAIFEDQYGNVTDLSFQGVVLNGNVEDTVFVFQPPDGATVIDN